ncbi:MAG: chemotaxis protein CheW [Myxococcales bacterium]|nr:MAG: chemotaxis protein CheW [Myxococcales bacterium]
MPDRKPDRRETPYAPEAAAPAARAERLLFIAAGRLWAVATRQVERSFYLESLTPVPLAPALAAGLANLRGEAVPVIDLAGLTEGSPAGRSPIGRRCLLVNAGGSLLALLTDEILRIVPTASATRLEAESPIAGSAFLHDGERIEELDVERLAQSIRQAIRRAGQRAAAGVR